MHCSREGRVESSMKINFRPCDCLVCAILLVFSRKSAHYWIIKFLEYFSPSHSSHSHIFIIAEITTMREIIHCNSIIRSHSPGHKKMLQYCVCRDLCVVNMCTGGQCWWSLQRRTLGPGLRQTSVIVTTAPPTPWSPWSQWSVSRKYFNKWQKHLIKYGWGHRLELQWDSAPAPAHIHSQ